MNEHTAASSRSSVPLPRRLGPPSDASQTLSGLYWFEVQSLRGELENGAVARGQVTLKVGFRIEELSD